MVKSIGMSQKNYLAIYHKKLVSLPEYGENIRFQISKDVQKHHS